MIALTSQKHLLNQIKNKSNNIDSEFNTEEEEKMVTAFLKTPCSCSQNCQKTVDS